jgi:cobalt-zinc-cadmium efflux system protein
MRDHPPVAHAHGRTHVPSSPETRRRLAIVLVLTAGFTVAEVVGGLIAGSLALLADAGHMLSDNLSLGVALFAAWAAQRPATARRTFGYMRAEILAALFNGVTLVAISIWIFVEAGRRFGDPPDVEGGLVLAVAAAGLVVNVAAAAILARGERGNLNVAAALRHVLADLLGSLGVLIAAVVILTTGWNYADPIVGVLIGVLVLASSWSVLRDSVQILLEGTPPGLDAETVGRRIVALEGVVEVHDLHIWTVTSGFTALAAHVLVRQGEDCPARRWEIERVLDDEFGIHHTTLQVDEQQPQELLQVERLDGR